MGFFGSYLYDGNEWAAGDLGSLRSDELESPYLLINIFDSDIAELRYSPCGTATGVAFLGFTPRAYFGDDSASAPTHAALEATGLAAWAEQVSGKRDLDCGDIEARLATDEQITLDVRPEHVVFVEEKAADLLHLLGVPAPVV